MNEDNFNMEMRKFLKKVGISSQREITHAVDDAISKNQLAGNETLSATMTLKIAEIDLELTIDGKIALD